jgi:hypothetical protein
MLSVTFNLLLLVARVFGCIHERNSHHIVCGLHLILFDARQAQVMRHLCRHEGFNLFALCKLPLVLLSEVVSQCHRDGGPVWNLIELFQVETQLLVRRYRGHGFLTCKLFFAFRLHELRLKHVDV